MGDERSVSRSFGSSSVSLALFRCRCIQSARPAAVFSPGYSKWTRYYPFGYHPESKRRNNSLTTSKISSRTQPFAPFLFVPASVFIARKHPRSLFGTHIIVSRSSAFFLHPPKPWGHYGDLNHSFFQHAAGRYIATTQTLGFSGLISSPLLISQGSFRLFDSAPDSARRRLPGYRTDRGNFPNTHNRIAMAFYH